MAAQRKQGSKTAKRRRQERRAAPEALPATLPQLVARTQGHNGGEPRAELTDDGLALLEAMASEGCDQRTIAARLQVGHGTLREMRDRDERVAEAWGRGHGRLADELTHHLLRSAREGNVVAAIFLTKARLGWREGTPAEGMQQNVQINIHIPPSMTREEFEELVARGQVAAA